MLGILMFARLIRKAARLITQNKADQEANHKADY